jgi:hypothetical protein
LTWHPALDVALLIFIALVLMFSKEIRNAWFGRRYFSAERKKLHNITRYLDGKR